MRMFVYTKGEKKTIEKQQEKITLVKKNYENVCLHKGEKTLQIKQQN